MVNYTIYFDTETGGVLPAHPTIQLAAVAVEDATLHEVAFFERKISFNESDADPEALKMNHYSAEAWQKSNTASIVAAQFAQFVKPFSSVQMMSKRTGKPYNVAKLAGYNALTFDLPRLKELFSGAFFPCAYIVRDVLQRGLFYFDEHDGPKPENMKLSTVCAHFGINTEGAHGALADARMSVALMRKFTGKS